MRHVYRVGAPSGGEGSLATQISPLAAILNLFAVLRQGAHNIACRVPHHRSDVQLSQNRDSNAGPVAEPYEFYRGARLPVIPPLDTFYLN